MKDLKASITFSAKIDDLKKQLKDAMKDATKSGVSGKDISGGISSLTSGSGGGAAKSAASMLGVGGPIALAIGALTAGVITILKKINENTVKMVSHLASASPMFASIRDAVKKAWELTLMPFGNFLAVLWKPYMLLMMNLARNFMAKAKTIMAGAEEPGADMTSIFNELMAAWQAEVIAPMAAGGNDIFKALKMLGVDVVGSLGEVSAITGDALTGLAASVISFMSTLGGVNFIEILQPWKDAIGNAGGAQELLNAAMVSSAGDMTLVADYLKDKLDEAKADIALNDLAKSADTVHGKMLLMAEKSLPGLGIAMQRVMDKMNSWSPSGGGVGGLISKTVSFMQNPGLSIANSVKAAGLD